MAKLNREDFISALKEMSILEIKELVDAMKEEFGVDPSAVAVAAGPAVAAVEEAPKTDYQKALMLFQMIKDNLIN